MPTSVSAGCFAVPEITDAGRNLVVRYRRPSGGATRSFDLVLQHLNGAAVAFTLTAERTRGGWRVLQAAIDLGETDANPDDAARDLADVRWHVFPARERGRVLPPVVAFWQEGGLVLAACLPDRYEGKRLSLARQEEWFAEDPEGEPPDPGRLLCWWPDPAAWEAAKEGASYLKLVLAKGAAVNFFTFREWFERADVKQEMEECVAELEEMDGDPDLRSEILAEIKGEEYARYIRRLRTMLLCYRERGIPIEVMAGDVRRAEAYFAREGLDPRDPSAWAACAFDVMPEFLLEEQSSCGPVGAVASGQKLRAAVSFYSHWPGVFPGVDATGVAVYAGATHLVSLVAWLNPLANWEIAAEKAADALFEELRRRNVRDICVVDGVFPFEVCPRCGGISLRVPDAWLKPGPVRVEKVGRNDPCPCGSGLKYKKCCGKTSQG